MRGVVEKRYFDLGSRDAGSSPARLGIADGVIGSTLIAYAFRLLPFHFL